MPVAQLADRVSLIKETLSLERAKTSSLEEGYNKLLADRDSLNSELAALEAELNIGKPFRSAFKLKNTMPHIGLGRMEPDVPLSENPTREELVRKISFLQDQLMGRYLANSAFIAISSPLQFQIAHFKERIAVLRCDQRAVARLADKKQGSAAAAGSSFAAASSSAPVGAIKI